MKHRSVSMDCIRVLAKTRRRQSFDSSFRRIQICDASESSESCGNHVPMKFPAVSMPDSFTLIFKKMERFPQVCLIFFKQNQVRWKQ